MACGAKDSVDRLEERVSDLEKIVKARKTVAEMNGRVRELIEENGQLSKYLIECRAAAGFGTADDPMEEDGWGAFADPAEVPGFVKAQFERLKKTDAGE